MIVADRKLLLISLPCPVYALSVLMQFAGLFVANFLHKAHVLGFVKSVSVLCTVLYMSMFVHATCFIIIIRGLRSQSLQKIINGLVVQFQLIFLPE